MTCLSVVQAACSEIGITKPTAVVTNTDPQIIQLLALSNREGRTLIKRGRWQNVAQEATFNTVATESQGAITTLAGADFNYILNDTIWNRDLKRPVFGPLAASQWQQLKAQSQQGPFNQFRIRANLLRFLPTPTAGQACAFEWVSKNWCQNTGATVSYSAWNADTDVGLLDEDLLTLGLIWRWKMAKGFDYAEDFAEYERQITDALGRDAGKPKLNLGGENFDIWPAIVVPSGSWSV